MIVEFNNGYRIDANSATIVSDSKSEFSTSLLILSNELISNDILKMTGDNDIDPLSQISVITENGIIVYRGFSEFREIVSRICDDHVDTSILIGGSKDINISIK